MSNWDNIERNVNKYGDFAGRTQAEQDAYYEFFAGTELSDRVAINAKKIWNIFARHLRRPLFGVDFSRSINSP